MAGFLGCASQYSADLIRIDRVNADGAALAKPTYNAYTQIERVVSGSWSRVADEPSSASIVLDEGCCDIAETIMNHIGLFDLRLNRDGVTVFEGPINRVRAESRYGEVTIEAGDVSWWLDELQIFNSREPSAKPPCFSYQGPDDPGFIARRAIQRALNERGFPTSDFPYMLDYAVWDDTIGKNIKYRNCDADLTVGDVLDDLTEYGLTWTVVGRSLIIGARPKVGTQPHIQLRGTDFDDPLEVEVDLEDLATQVFAVSQTCRKVPCRYSGSGDDIRDNYASAYGYRDQILDVGYGPDGEPNWAEMREAACDAQRGRSRVKPQILADSPARLLPTAPVTLDQLIPGRTVARIGIVDACLKTDDDFVLEALEVDFDFDSENVEDVSCGWLSVSDYYEGGQTGYIDDRQKEKVKPVKTALKSASRKAKKTARVAKKRTWCND
jgi:hypothetical protein